MTVNIAQEDQPGIAVVGMAGRFPQAADIDEFWRHLCAGRECLSRFGAAELRAAGVPLEVLNDPRHVPRNGSLAEIEMFDADFFGMSPGEASLTDPQHRVFLELVWHALEHAGYDPARYRGTIGVYAGCGASSYLLHHLRPQRTALAEAGSLRARIANGQEYLATRVSYKLNLTGPSVNVSTACSTSLVAVHMACDALMAFQCDMALGGGISIQLPQSTGYLYEEGGILSPDGHCRAFDAKAQGTVSGNGGAVVVLKRVADALADGDTVYAVIRGSAINNDGAAKAFYTAPSIHGQTRVIAEAQAVAGIAVETIGYIEAHGTGTPLGDPIEFAALTQTFRRHTARTQFCAIGSVKTNVGHLDEAAGVTGLIKTALSLYHGQIPPSLHFEKPNPEIAYSESPFYVNTKLEPWPVPADGGPRRAGVSSFGIGGTNAHVVLEEAPTQEAKPWTRPVQLLTYSASTAATLARRRVDLSAWLAAHPEQDLADTAYTLQVGRRTFATRGFVLGADAAEARGGLDAPSSGRTTAPAADAPPVVMMFSGQGSQHPGMARALYEHEPVFRHWMDVCAEQLRPLLGVDLRLLLFPASSLEEGSAAIQLQQTALAQPALFAVEYALAQLWAHWGVRPQGLIGHSLGEYVAACVAGVLDLESALVVVSVRGRLMQSAAGGAMLAVPLSPAEVRHYLSNGLEIAAVNAADRCVVAGPAASMQLLAERLSIAGCESQPLPVSHAFHTASMTPILDAFAQELKRHPLRSPQLPYISNLTGDWIKPAEATAPEYYVRHLRQPVQFAAGLSRLLEDYPRAILLEVGPGHALTRAARRSAPAETLCLPSLPPALSHTAAHRTLLSSLGQLWERGVDVDWAAFAEVNRRRVALPGYPFQRQRHWIKAKPETIGSTEDARAGENTPSAAASLPVKWCYLPCWRPAPAPPTQQPGGHWLLFGDGSDAAAAAQTLRQAGCRVTLVQRSGQWADLGAEGYCLRPQSGEDYLTLLQSLKEPATQIVWLWSYGPAGDWLAEDWCYALLALLQALQHLSSPPRLNVVTTGLAAVKSGERAWLEAEKGTLPGLLRAARMEYPQSSIRLIDLMPSALNDAANVQALLELCQEDSDEAFVAWRAGQRWQPEYEPLLADKHQAVSLRQGGTYLITGGLGGIGLTLADDLARNWQARLVLVARTILPPEQEWPSVMANPGTSPALRQTLLRLQAIRKCGTEIMIEKADVADRDELTGAINRARSRFGKIHGVIHAAGVADGALLARQTRDGFASVLAAKLAGTRLLTELLADEPLDFCLLCSALSAISGAPGQAAYCAANSFLDHFAQAANVRWPILAINWDAWREIGMAANQTLGVPVSHPLLRARMPDAEGRAVYMAQLRPREHWVLAEHRVGEQALLPGTAYLELACAAARECCGATAFEIQDIYLLQPLILAMDDTVNLKVTLTPDDGHFQFKIQSQVHGGPVELNAEGRVFPLHASPLARQRVTPLDDLIPDTATNDDSLARRLKQFGPRWHCLKKLGGQKREIAELALAAEYETEAESFLLHPALLDVATGFAVLDKDHDAALLPFAYRRLRLYAPLPARLRSELLAWHESGDGLHLDLRLFDQQGQVLAEIEDYQLRRTERGMPGTNHRLALGRAGDLDDLGVEACARPAPGLGTVEIEVYASGLNFKDVLNALGMLPAAEIGDGQFGLECAGRVSRVGDGVMERHPGEAVVAYAAGCLKSYVVVPASQVKPLPTGLSFAAGASLPAAFLTAYHALIKQARLSRGETILIHAATGGVGLAAVHIALGVGAKVLATAGSPRKRDFLLQQGVAAVFDSRSSAFVEGVRQHTAGRGVNVVLNSLSGELLSDSLECLASYGRFLELGVRDIHAGKALDLRHFAKSISFSAISLAPDMPGFADLFAEVWDQFRAGALRPLPHQVFPLAASSSAFHHMAQARHIGKVVIALHPQASAVVEPETWTLMPGLSCADGISLFYQTLAAGKPQVIVSQQELQERLARLRGVALPDYGTVKPGGGVRPALDIPYATPQGESERSMTAILERLLGLGGIGRDDDFFALGGDSLIGMQFVAQINRQLGSHLTLRDLFAKPTIAALASRLAAPESIEAGRILPVPPSSDYPLTHAQKRLWILAQNPTALVAYNMSYSFLLKGTLNSEALRQAFRVLVKRHEALRMAFITVDGEPRQQVQPARSFALPMLDLRSERNTATAAEREVVADELTPFRLDEPPLLRARLLRLAEQEHVLLLSLHHIIADGLSLNVLMRELHTCYFALDRNRMPDLPPLQIQFKDFAVWQQGYLKSETMQVHRRYWLDKLSGDLPVLELPTDQPRTAFQQFAGGQLVLRFPVSARDALRRYCREEGVTLFMLLVAAVKILLHHATGQAEILVGSPVAGRTQAELEGQVGFYLNNVVLRDVVRRGEPFQALLRRVRDTVTEALAHQDYPFDLLIEDLTIPPTPGRTPLFDAQVNLMPGDTPSLKLGDLSVSAYRAQNQTTLFDLNFMFSDGPDGLIAEIGYNRLLFDAIRIASLGDSLLRLLTAIAEQPKSLQMRVRSLCDLLEESPSAMERVTFMAAALQLDEEF